MACSPRYVGLPCRLSGVGYSAAAIPLGAVTVQLQVGHGQFFPDIGEGQFFYAEITDACHECCEIVRVVEKTDDVLTIIRDAPTCNCFSSNSRIRYTVCTYDAILAIAEEAPINVVPPLQWNCETRTLSINCAELQEMISNPCG